MSDLFESLLDAMPPPAAGADADELLAAFAMMSDRCEAILEGIDDAAIDRTDPRVAELRARKAAWLQALTAARDTVRAQYAGAAKLRHYAKAL